MAAGSKCEVGGALYEFTADEAGTGWAGIGVSTWAYILLTPSGATVSWSYTEVAPTWSTSKQGWYTGDNRVIGGLYKDAGGLYTLKWLYRAGSGGIQDFREYGNGTVSFAGAVTASGGIDPGGNGVILKCKVIEIGDWDMDTDASKAVAHGLDATKIRSIEAIIRDDVGNYRGPINQIKDAACVAQGGITLASSTSVTMFRLASGQFDGVNYDATSYNRGWITIWYEV